MNDAYQVVYTAQGHMDAEMMKVFLEARGFEVMLAGESAGRTYGFSFGPMGEVQVLVPNEQAADARATLDAMDRGEFEQAGPEDEPPDA